MSDLVQRLRDHGKIGKRPISIADVHLAADRIEQLEQRESELVQQCGELNDEINRMRNEHARQVEQLERSNKELRDALELAEDVLSRFPYSAEFWPNGMHPQIGISQIRAALSAANKGKENG